MMETESPPLDELTREIRKLIDENQKFLDKVLDDEFEPEEDDLEPPPEIEI